MPMITVQMFPGRTPEQKAELAERLTEVFLEICGRPGQKRESIWLVINEVPREHWAVGGKLGSPSE